MIPPGQSTGELVKALGTSKSSTSTMSRLLEQVGLIDRYRKPGSREMHHRVTPGAWQTVFERQGDEIINLRRLAERGIAAVGNDTNRGNRLVEMRDAFLFWEREWPALMERWKKGTT
ncbi:MAG: MarR family transcriptional regulator [Actinobacteria bacterium]|nr:MarR family transcriptional regulator [Actinomycetota bacterium]